MATFVFSRSIYYVKNNLDLSKNKLGFTKHLSQKKMFLEAWHYVYSQYVLLLSKGLIHPANLNFHNLSNINRELIWFSCTY